MIKDIIRLIRPVQWIKNAFVFLPLFFGGYLFDGEAWVQSSLTFISFALMSSAIYCLNDICDVESDRIHPVKRKRPIASGAISVRQASLVMIILVILSLSVSLFTLGDKGLIVSGVISTYLALNVAYCFGLKKVSVLDVFIIAFGFVLRLMAGGVACNIALSPWIVLMTFLLALFMAFAKRRDDVLLRERDGIVARKNTQRYNISFLNSVLVILASVTVVCYIMYTVSPEVTEKLNTRYIYISTIPVLAGIIRYLQLTMVDEKSGSPTRILTHDLFIQLCCVVWMAFFAIVIY